VVSRRVEAGDHTVFIGEVKAAGARDGRPLVYFLRDYRSIG
jgi:flavin reductase (DIM6/NTAB) family NADH-FMN oxidoreductase RutF